jgi:dienelactone hydrolase
MQSTHTPDGQYFMPDQEQRSGAAVIMLPAIAGLNPYIEVKAGLLTALGHSVFAVDYFGGAGAPDLSSPDRIMAAAGSLDAFHILGQVRSAVARFRDQGIDASRIATLGYCIGGSYAILAATEMDLAASVNYYGSVRLQSPTGGTLDLAQHIGALRVPLLSHYGTADRFVPAADVEAFFSRIDAAGKVHEGFMYTGAPHAFDEDFRDAYRPVASQQAWARTSIFLRWYLSQ